MKPIIIIFLFFIIFSPFHLKSEEQKDDIATTLYLESNYNDVKDNKEFADLIDALIQICRCIENANESVDPLEVFNEKKKEIFELLRKATEISQNPSLKKYLNSLAENIMKDVYSESQVEWLNIKESVIDLIIKTPEKQKKISFFLLKVDQKNLKTYEKYFSLMDKMMVNSTMKNTPPQFSVSFENPFLFFDIIRSSAEDRFVFIHPDQSAEDKKNHNFKIIFCTNLIKFYFEKIIKPISKLILADRLRKYVEFDAYLSNLVMHRMSHAMGPFNIESKSEALTSPQEKLKEWFYCIEEIKAEMVSLYNIPVLLKEKLISEKDERAMYVLFVLNLIEKVRVNPLEEEKKPYLIVLNYLLKNEGIIYDINQQQLLVNFSKLKAEIKNLMNEVIQIERSGNYNRAKKIIESYSSVPNVVDVIIKLIEKIPRNIKIAVN